MNKIKVTIGLMVYNEAESIKKTLKNICQQSFVDYELLVGDNASTDGSSEIIEEIANQDKRIVHIKRTTNIGAIQNWNDIVKRAKGKYFVLAGGHDLWSYNYLKSLYGALEINKNAVLAFAMTQWKDRQGNDINIPTSLLDTSGMSVLGRFASLMFANQHYLYGMARLSAIKKTRLQKEIIGSGEIYLQELAQLGAFQYVEKERWFRVTNRDVEDTFSRLCRYRKILFSSKLNQLKFNFFPFTQMILQYLLLPFMIKNLSLFQRFSLITTYPIILFRFCNYFASDIIWLVKR